MKNWKTLRILFLSLAVAIPLGGCSQPKADSLKEQLESAMDGVEWKVDGSEVSDHLEDILKKIGDAAEELSGEETGEEMEAAPGMDGAASGGRLEDAEDGYAFSCLIREEKTVYLEVLYTLQNFLEDQEVSTKDTGVLEKVFQCVLMDHPEIFYCTTYRYNQILYGDEVAKLQFSGVYAYDRKEAESRRERIRKAVRKITGGITDAAQDEEEGRDYEKAKYLYEYVIRHTDYVKDAEDHQNICSVFLGGQSVCQGYAAAYQYLLQQIGIPATLVTGTVHGDAPHAWVLALLDGDYYYIDPTWGDASYAGEEDGSGKLPELNYDYFCITTEQLERTHRIDSVIEFPMCIAEKDNYFVREGALFDSYDPERLGRIFADAQKADSGFVSIRCSETSVYEDMVQKLIDEKKIFDFPGVKTSNLAYSRNQEILTLTFWENN